MKRNVLTLLLLLAIFTSCKKDSETKTSFQFNGNYKGSYTGGDTGSIIVTVDGVGILKGTAVSSKTLDAFGITGTVDASGTFNGITDIGTTFKGTFTTSNVTGTWSNSNLKLTGLWSGVKQ